jgi:hypothetical protein
MMRREFTHRTIGFLFLAGVVLNVPPAVASDSPTDIVTHGENAAADRAALAAAVALLPKRPVRIAVVDVRQNRPQVRDYLLTLDAFTVNGNAVIYVVRQSAVLKAARGGSTLFRAMLATILWHEMAHLAGEDEHGARKAEEELWQQVVRDGVTDQVTGLRYLQALRRRPDDQLLASK